MAERKHGSMIPRGDNKWLLRWFVGRSPTGKRQYKSETFEGTTAQARKQLAKMTTEVNEGTAVMPTQHTVRSYLEWWLEHVQSKKVTEATLNSYRDRLNYSIFKSALGTKKLQKLAYTDIEMLYNELLKTSSTRTVQYTHTVLKMALKHALRTKLIRENPCDHASPGKKVKAKDGNDGRTVEAFNAREVQIFLDRTRKEYQAGTHGHNYPLWFLLLTTGLRPGEALGLKWSDIQGDKLSVTRAVAETAKKGVYTLEAPKTKKSVRTISLTQECVETLNAHKKRQAAEILAAGSTFTRNDFVFPAKDGSFDNPKLIARRWSRSIKRINRGLTREGQQLLNSKITLYGTRHTHATMLLQAGVNPKVVSERLGHSTVVITLDTYSHVLQNIQEEAVLKLERLMAR
jgi:integrase